MPNLPFPYVFARAPDVRIIQHDEFPAYSVTLDWQLLSDGTLDDTQALANAVIVALGTNSLAATDDLLPDPDSSDRMGWWGDMDADSLWGAWPIGCKLWLLTRSAILPAGARSGATQVWVERYIETAMQPFIDRKICSSFTVDTIQVDAQRIDALLTVYRGVRNAIQLRYQILWREITP
jgi:phage gp46-like protein